MSATIEQQFLNGTFGQSNDDDERRDSDHDSDVSHSGSDESEDDEAFPLRAQGISPTETRPLRTSGPQTGPKSVIADYKYHKHLQRENEKARKNEALARLTQLTGRIQLEETVQENILRNLVEDEADLDEEFFKEYKAKRLEELKRKRPQFGFLLDVTQDTYVEVIDRESPFVPVIVHIYENHIDACRQVNDCLSWLSRKYGHAKFVKVKAREVEFDEIGVPALLTYKAGLLISHLIRVTDEFPGFANGAKGGRIDREDVETVLLRSGALSESDHLELDPVEPQDSKPNHGEDYDSDD